MKLISSISICILLIACSVNKKGGTVNGSRDGDSTFNVISESDTIVNPYVDTLDNQPKNYSVKIHITHYTPYCGGMAPSPEIIANQTQPQSNTYFLLLNLNTGQKTKVKTDSEGYLLLKLGQGKYAIREMYKDVSFETFKEQNYEAPTENRIESPEEDCYKKWWKANLGEFSILAGDETQSIEMSSSARCFIGINPCLNYMGPYPP